MDDLKHYIKNLANDFGFGHCGFAGARPLDIEFQHYLHWLELDFEADMQYLSKYLEKRKNPLEILPTAKTIIVLAHSYKTPFEYPATSEPVGYIARYAWGDDYHDVLKGKASLIMQKLSEKVDFEYKIYVDTGPVLERAWAVRSGVGWQGKNGNIINSELGSYIFLCVVLVSLELEPDTPAKDYCGTCQRCLLACPTGAIVQPKVVDARRCLAYWNIEAKPEATPPQEISGKFGSRLFGCDICQEVCPYNNKNNFTQETRFYPRNGETALNLIEILSMTQQQFSERFRRSPIKRKKLQGLKKNAEILFKNV
ncbi:MAG: tRNA epoxyqueuosine(34) reductase QueG [Bacteroidota bacterium]